MLIPSPSHIFKPVDGTACIECVEWISLMKKGSKNILVEIFLLFLTESGFDKNGDCRSIQYISFNEPWPQWWIHIIDVLFTLPPWSQFLLFYFFLSAIRKIPRIARLVIFLGGEGLNELLGPAWGWLLSQSFCLFSFLASARSQS